MTSVFRVGRKVTGHEAPKMGECHPDCPSEGESRVPKSLRVVRSRRHPTILSTITGVYENLFSPSKELHADHSSLPGRTYVSERRREGKRPHLLPRKVKV